tara:strand:+ start:182 stop:553 length:372 start_codon:yes stop_codon:yes gene_type:complete
MRPFIYLLFISGLISQDGIEELDLDAMWENTVWEEIKNVETLEFEVEKVTAVAGVRGAEAEDEALEHLYYRRSMRGLSKLDIQKVLGKLIIKRDKLLSLDEKHLDIPKLNQYIKELRKRLKNV